MSEMTIKSFVQQSIDKYLEKRQNLCKEFTSSKMERIKNTIYKMVMEVQGNKPRPHRNTADSQKTAQQSTNNNQRGCCPKVNSPQNTPNRNKSYKNAKFT